MLQERRSFLRGVRWITLDPLLHECGEPRKELDEVVGLEMNASTLFISHRGYRLRRSAKQWSGRDSSTSDAAPEDIHSSSACCSRGWRGRLSLRPSSHLLRWDCEP